MIGRGFHSGFGIHGFGDLWLIVSGMVAIGLVSAVVWVLGRLAPKNYDAELARKKEELGLPPD